MGKGDKRTKRGKIISGSFGNSRPTGAKIRSAKKAIAIANAKEAKGTVVTEEKVTEEKTEE